MAYIEYRRFTDLKSLAQDSAVEATDVLYIPLFDDFEELSIVSGDPDKPGAVAAYMEEDACKLAIYNGDGTWSVVGGSGLAVSSLLTISTDTTIDWTDTAPDQDGNPSGQTWAERFGNNIHYRAERELPSGPYAGEYADYTPTVVTDYDGSGNLTQVRILDVMPDTRIIIK